MRYRRLSGAKRDDNSVVNKAEPIGLPKQALDRLRQAKRVAILTGAGVSAESNVPTFRDKLVGLWARFDPTELATPEAFQRDPALVWGWYEWRRATVLRAQPNAGHRAIATMTRLIPKLTLITQNVDDLHERAGSRDVLHLHGELAKPYCQGCLDPYVLPPGIPEIPAGGQRIEPPNCTRCGCPIRPGVVWFGEGLPARKWQAAADAARNCNVFLSVGTSSVVQPAASLIKIATMAGAFTIQVNPSLTEADNFVSLSLKGAAGMLLPAVLEAVWGVGPGEDWQEHQPEVILQILAEGGSVTLFGLRDLRGGWQFARELTDATRTMLDEADQGEAKVQSRSDWVRTWAEAMALLDRYPWPMLQCREIHPEFRNQVWTEVTRRLQGKTGVQADNARKRWIRDCEVIGSADR